MASVVRGDGRAYIEGLDSLKVGLRAAGPGVIRQLAKAHRRVAAVVAKDAKAATDARKKGAINAKGLQNNAIVEIGGNPPDAIGRFFGAKRRFGWYAKPQFKQSSGQQFPRWVGNQWELGGNSGKPYEIGDAINKAVEKAEEVYEEEIDKAFVLAFPIKTG